MRREGYEVELVRERSAVTGGPALLLAGTADHSGLFISKVRDVAETLDEILGGGLTRLVRTDGMWTFLPVPFGSNDVLRVVWAVSDFRERRSPGLKET